ncbi:DNA sulfur modification protein DndD [Methylobacillus sp. Pita1]|uniref:DNA sulfur modification protein DndD n=1 Tax=Methylobacillus sp. Pita1 TaxID=3382642 RepID=UPI0038B4E74F
MWISKLELINFKSYQHQVFEFPLPANGQNIVLIGGMNGYGKTSILEAVYLGLYGKDAISHLGRAGLKDDVGYRSFLERALHGHAIRAQRDSMTVTIQINISENEGFQITRRWYFSRSGDWTDEEILIYSIRNGIKDKVVSSDRIEELLDQQFIPAHIAPFFFFDGEEVKKLADQNRVEQIKQGIEGLLGVVLLRKLEKRLQQYQANRSQGVSAVDEQKHRELLETLTKHEEEFVELESRKNALDIEVEDLKINRADLMNRVVSIGGGGGDIANARDLVSQQAVHEQELKEVFEQLEKILATKLPFHFVDQDLIKGFSETLRSEINLQQWNSRKSSLEPEKEKFTANFFKSEKPEFSPELTTEQETAIRLRLETAWESLFYPPPADCAETMVHDYMSSERKQNTLHSLQKIHLGSQEILGLMLRREELTKKIRDIRNRYTRIEGLDRDGSLTKLNTELASVNASLDLKQKSLGDLERQLSGLSATINNDRAVYQREHEKFVQANPVKSGVAKAQRVIDLMRDLIPQLYTLKIKHLAEAMTEVYKKLAHKSQVSKIEIDETGAAKILSIEGDEISFDKSAGENQVFATALLAGLAKISGLDAPLIVDTPLGRLDSTHRTNILSYWVSDRSRQVILLSQDKEIDLETYNTIKSAVSKTYLLQHQDIGNGVSKTTAIEGQYFKGLPNE